MWQVRPLRPGDVERVAELTARSYLDEGFGSPAYEPALRDVAGRAAAATVLVAEPTDPMRGPIAGTVTVATHGGAWAEHAQPGEAHLRMLAVDRAARGSGAGEALVRAALGLARADGCTAVSLSTEPAMAAAQRLYGRLGFVRVPARDWEPAPGVSLLCLRRELLWCDHCGGPDEDPHHPCQQARQLEPPRFCAQCRRRMVVQITPGGWTARCVEHGNRTG